MTEITFNLSQEDLREQIIDRAAEKLVDSVRDDAFDVVVATVTKTLNERRVAAVDKAVETVVAPYFTAKIEELVFQQTNEWGEKSNKPAMTFTEFVIARLDAYMKEGVDRNGKPKGNDYNWTCSTTRVAWAIEKHLQLSMEAAMKEALGTANTQIADGITVAIRFELNKLLQKLSVNLTV